MRLPAAIMAVAALALLAAGAWAAGCADLSGDCELNVNCPELPQTTDPPQCNGLYIPGACNTCLVEECCQELADCDDDGACLNYCVFGVLPSPPECSQSPTMDLLNDLAECMNVACPVDCAPKDQCNPITGNGCPPDGTACELVYPGMFVCIPPFGSPGAICGACDNLNGPYCGGGVHCFAESNTCARYCCNDADCGTGRCELDPMKAFGAPLVVPGDAVGLCVHMTPGMGAACDAPPQSPSGGTCFAGFPPM